MNEIHAVVRRLGEKCVWVETNVASSCSRCQGGVGCSSVSISRLFCSATRQFRIESVAGDLQIGDIVRLGIPEDEVLQAALLGYGLPVLGLVAGALFGSILFPERGDFASVGFGIAGFLAGLWAVRYVGLKVAAPRLLGKISGPVLPLVVR